MTHVATSTEPTDRIATDDGDLPLTLVRGQPTGAAIVIVPSAFGVGSDLVEQMRELALDARLVATFDPFFRSSPGLVPYDDMPRVMARIRGSDPQRTLADLRALVAWARSEDPAAPVILVGICFGAVFAVLAAADGLADAVVTWHGSRLEQYVDRAASIRGPIHFHIGGVDPVMPPVAVEAVRQAFAGHPDARFFIHAGATHGFTHRGAEKAYDAAAERAAMDSVRELTRLTRP